MKTDWTHLEQFRHTEGLMGSTSQTHGRNGAFVLPRGRVRLYIIASCGDQLQVGWEHVSVHAQDYKGVRCPTWDEMCCVKDLFWEAEECVVQYHPPRSQWVNNHPHTLHLWKRLGEALP